jgi:hypothetical protein
MDYYADLRIFGAGRGRTFGLSPRYSANCTTKWAFGGLESQFEAGESLRADTPQEDSPIPSRAAEARWPHRAR